MSIAAGEESLLDFHGPVGTNKGMIPRLVRYVRDPRSMLAGCPPHIKDERNS